MFSDHPEGVVFASLVGAFGVSFLVGRGLMRLRPHVERISKERDDYAAVQASHVGDPLRLGGLAVVLGVLAGASALAGRSDGTFTLLLLTSLVPVFAAGLWEDLGHGFSAGRRFIASIISASVAVSLLGFWVTRGDLWGLNALMGFIPAGVVITILLAALFCHAVNLIDGMNGLAAMAVILASLGLAFIAQKVELHQIMMLGLLLSASATGFQLLNWPKAKLFLGDAGAYGLGHLLVFLGISTIALAPTVAVPAVILVLFYPFADTFHTILRRVLEHKKITEPDRMHLHQKVRRGLEIVWIGRDNIHLSNPITTVLMLPLVAGPVLTGVILWNQPNLAWISVLAFGFIFVVLHVLITAMAKRYRKHAEVSERAEVREC